MPDRLLCMICSCTFFLTFCPQHQTSWKRAEPKDFIGSLNFIFMHVYVNKTSLTSYCFLKQKLDLGLKRLANSAHVSVIFKNRTLRVNISLILTGRPPADLSVICLTARGWCHHWPTFVTVKWHFIFHSQSAGPLHTDTAWVTRLDPRWRVIYLRLKRRRPLSSMEGEQRAFQNGKWRTLGRTALRGKQCI